MTSEKDTFLEESQIKSKFMLRPLKRLSNTSDSFLSKVPNSLKIRTQKELLLWESLTRLLFMEENSTTQKRRKLRPYLVILEVCFPQRVLAQGILKLTDWVKGKVPS